MISPASILDNAGKILALDNSEECARAAASRAYYSAFHACREVANKYVMVPAESGGVHEQLYTAMLNCHPGYTDNYKDVRKLAYMAREIKTIRINADYAIETRFPFGDAVEAIAKSKKLIEQAALA